MTMQSSILAWENPMNRGAWWAIVHRVAESWTILKQLSTYTLKKKNKLTWEMGIKHKIRIGTSRYQT